MRAGKLGHSAAVKSRIHHIQLRLLLYGLSKTIMFTGYVKTAENQCCCTLTTTTSHPPAPCRLVGGSRAKPHCTCRCLSLITQITSAVLIGCAAARAAREHKQLAFYSQVLVFLYRSAVAICWLSHSDLCMYRSL